MTIKENKTKQKRLYIKDPLIKLKNGEPWTINFDLDVDVAEKVLEEKKKSPPGTQIQYILNKALRKAFKLKAK